MKDTSKEESFKLQVLEQAKKLIEIFGYHSLVMEDIARAVGKSRSTLYLYFKDKEDIFDYVINDELASYKSKLAENINEIESADKMFVEFIAIKLNFVISKIRQYEHLSAEIDTHPEILKRILSLSSPDDLMILESIILKGTKDGVFKGSEPNKLDLRAKILLDCINGITGALGHNYSDVKTLILTVQELLLGALFIKNKL
ncbi:TetR/AcrR family transcriptional regulator [Pedobacter sp. MC2016-24]|uniref:TetR/AcrR family transcriptional regulator n=1 Tax=Pedobacter sp. MC2016-24 TaxID=2780090 RepID=UPI001881A470|nr:TetR/AcrR family transcriptional regulator [Pedobacter sp. MC2016-24]MBE9599810.1 TetR/AcrR family transcriptional regulator [Pedobacter sp. MC2016-24]